MQYHHNQGIIDLNKEVGAVAEFVRRFEHSWMVHNGVEVCSVCGKWKRGTIGGCYPVAFAHVQEAPLPVQRVLQAVNRFDTRLRPTLRLEPIHRSA
jgi:hypothetical protein